MTCPRCHKTPEKHEAGRETDACIAKVVMGYEEPFGDAWLRHYSTRIADAWEVVEKLESCPNHVLFSCSRKSGIQGQLIWSVVFREVLGQQHDYYTEANDLPLAICRTALMTSKEE